MAATAAEASPPKPSGRRRPGEGAARLAAQEEEALGAPALSSDELVAEGHGDTLGEAKWAAMKELETRFPGLTQDHVSFDVTEDGEADGPARVRAEVDRDAWEAVADAIPEEATERVRAIVARVVNALGLHATVDIDETTRRFARP